MAWTKSTTTKHTCGGVKFGRKTAGCPRCDELIAGAKPAVWNTRNKSEASFIDAIRRHSCHASKCGVVCTAFDW
jgi:hypothetical protein